MTEEKNQEKQTSAKTDVTLAEKKAAKAEKKEAKKPQEKKQENKKSCGRKIRNQGNAAGPVEKGAAQQCSNAKSQGNTP